MSAKQKTLELVYLTEPDRDKWVAAEWESSNEFAEPTNIYMINSVDSALRAALNQERAEKAAVEGISAVLGVKLIVTGGLKVRECQDRQGQQRQSLDLQARHVGIIHTEQRNGQGQKQWGARQPASTGSYAPAPGAPAQDPWGGVSNDDPVF